MNIGDEVGWQWANGLATGIIESINHERTEIVSKGAYIVRNGTTDDPAIVITHKNGSKVLKLQHELKVIKHEGGNNV